MNKLKIGDIVARKSYGMDVYFKVKGIKYKAGEVIAELKGLSYRILADAPASDLVAVPESRLNEFRKKEKREIDLKREMIRGSAEMKRQARSFFHRTRNNREEFKRPGKVLHLDGDEDYLETCLQEYKKLDIEAIGKYVPESSQPSEVLTLLNQYRPDILVLTGHDSVAKGEENYMDLASYRNSKYFIGAVAEARKYEPDLDALVIFAGACQSMYSEIINAGANYASSPQRVLIHTLDPVLVTEKVAYTDVDKLLLPRTIVSNTITGEKGIGGLETKGKCRNGFPSEPYGMAPSANN
jgi:spore coat assembly protein